MNKQDIPCIKNKCILLPVCKAKRNIACNILREYTDSKYKQLEEGRIDTITVRQMFEHLLTVFNNIEGVYSENIKDVTEVTHFEITHGKRLHTKDKTLNSNTTLRIYDPTSKKINLMTLRKE